MSNQKYFDVPFGFSGDVTAIPDPLQVGGSVSFTEGWNFNYQRDLATDPAALPIDRSTMNWLLLQITTALQALQAETIPEWITSAQNAGTPLAYGQGSEVLWSASGNAPFTKFVSLVAGNVATPSLSDLLGTTTGWQRIPDAISSPAQAAAGTDNNSIMTPLLVAQQTALRALLAGNTSQVFNVGPAVSGTQAPQLQQMTGRLLRVTAYSRNSSNQLTVSVNGGAFVVAGSAVFTALAATTNVEIEGAGGGGAGGGSQATTATQLSSGSGGAAGGYGRGYYPVASVTGQTVSAGLAGSGVTGGNGNAGTASTVGALISIPGGSGGVVGPIQISPLTTTIPSGGANSAIGTGGYINAAGQVGGYALYYASSSLSGPGGFSYFGGGGNPVGPLNSSGVSGTAPGSGGSGGNTANSGIATGGGFGGVGLIIIREYA